MCNGCNVVKYWGLALSVMALALGRIGATVQINFLDSLFNQSVYNRMERPGTSEGEPLVVFIDIFISGMGDFSEKTMNYHVTLFLRQRWADDRLSFRTHPLYNNTTMTLNYQYINKMWQPGIFLKNEVTKGSFHDVTVPNIMLNLDPSGQVLYSQRISTKLSCNMKLEKYPFDNQTCYIELEIFDYKRTDILLKWNGTNPIQTNTNLELPEFNLTSYSTGGCVGDYTTGTFSCLHLALHFKRLRSYYIIQVYLPTVLFVILSWLSFWIDHKSVPARITVGLLTVLTITTKSSVISSSLPKVSYIKAIDVWMFTCTVFVFAALIEYSIVNVLFRRQEEEILQSQKRKNKYKNQNGNTKADDNKTSSDVGVSTTQCHDLCDDKAYRIDNASRYIFPIAFVIFNMIYWFPYLLFF